MAIPRFIMTMARKLSLPAIHHFRRGARLPFAIGTALVLAASMLLLLAPFGAQAGTPICVGNACTLTETTLQDFATGQFYLTGLRGTGNGEVELQPIGITTPWVTDTYRLPEARSEMASVVYHDILYVIGGYNSLGLLRSTVYTAATSLNGSLLAPGWRNADNLPQARVSSVAVVSPTQTGGFLYVLGGRTSSGVSGVTSTLVYKTLDAGGALTGQWLTASMPPVNAPNGNAVALVYLQALVRGGYLYVLGGLDGFFNSSRLIYRAPLNSDGSPGTWTLETSPVPDAGGRSGRSSFAVVVGPNSGGTDYLYVLAGQSGSGGSISSVPDVNYAAFNADGTLGAFSSAQPLSALYGHGAVQSGGQIFVSGGSKGVGSTVIISEVQAALIDAQSGALRDLGGGAFWQTSTPLAQPRQYHGTGINSGGEIYVIGGYAPGGIAQDTIFRGGSGGVGSSYASSGGYASRVIDLGGLFQLSTLKWNTDLNAGLGESITLQYRSAGTQNALLAQPWSTAGNSAPGAGITNTFTFAGVAANFIQYRALFTITAPFNHTPVLNAVELRYSAAGPDLQVTESDGIKRARIGDVLTYTIIYTNNDSRIATGVILTETPPLSTTFVGGNAGWSPISGVYRLVLGSLAPHAVGSATFAVKVDGKPQGGLLNNIVEIGYDNSMGTDPNVANNVSIDSDAIDVIDLQITTTDFKSDVVVSSTNSYSITYGNAGQLDAPNVIITATIPPGARYLGGPPWTPIGNGQFVLPVGTVAGSSSNGVGFNIFISDTLNVGQAFTQSVKISTDGSQGPDADPSNNVYSDIDTTLPSGPDLVISLSDGRPVVARGDVLTYSLGIANVGGSMALNSMVTETVPANTTFLGPNGWTLIGGGTYTRSLGNIASGDFRTVQFIAQVDFAAPLGPLTNTAYASTLNESSLVLGDNTATDIDVVSTQFVDLQVHVSDGLSSPAVGQALTYTINYANPGNSLASGVALTATLSPGLNFTGSGWVPVGGGRFTRNVGSVGAGAASTVTLLAQVDPATAANTYVSNSVSIDFSGLDAFPGNNTASDIDFISPPRLLFQIDDGVAAVVPGQTLSYAFQYRNAGSVTATNVILTETLPLASVMVADANGWTPSGNSYVRTVPDLGPGGFASVSFGLTVLTNATAGDLITNTGRLHASNQTLTGDSVYSDTDIVASSAPPDLQVSASAGSNVGLGTAASVLVTVTNAGPGAASNWFSAEIYLDRIPQSRTDLGDAHIEIGDLSSGAQQTVVFNTVWSSPGTHTLYVQVDTCDLVDPGWCSNPSYGRIAESNESNNVFGPLNVVVLPYTIFLPIITR